MGPLPGTKWDPSLGQTGLSLLNSTVKSLFCPVCPWDGWGFVPGTIVPQGPSEKCLCVFCLLVSFAPNKCILELVPHNGFGHTVVRMRLHSKVLAMCRIQGTSSENDVERAPSETRLIRLTF